MTDTKKVENAQAVADKCKAHCSACAYDRKGRPILPGDTLKVFHFRAALRRERRYMYKYVICYHESGKTLVVSHLNPSGETYYLSLDGKMNPNTEIVQGYVGVPLGCDFRDRKPNATVTVGGERSEVENKQTATNGKVNRRTVDGLVGKTGKCDWCGKIGEHVPIWAAWGARIGDYNDGLSTSCLCPDCMDNTAACSECGVFIGDEVQNVQNEDGDFYCPDCMPNATDERQA